jgi:hypothetical protein
MAKIQSSNLSASVSNLDGNTSRINWSSSVTFNNWYYYGVRQQTSVNGAVVGDASGYTTGGYETTCEASGSNDFSRGHSAYNIGVATSYWGETVDGYGSVGESGGNSTTVTIPAKPAYGVSYNANGGASTPGGQTKWYDESLTLNGSTSRTGYTFLYWAGSDGKTYYPGSVFTGNYGLTLTAVWQINTWQVSYNANGGYSAPSNQVKTYNQRLYLSADKPSKALYNFVSWSGSDGNTYYQGSPFDGNYALTLTANWTLAYIQPTINNVLAYHTDASGNSGDFDYITVKVNWTVNRDIYPSNIGQSIRIRYKEVGTSTWITGAEVYLLSSAKQSGENYITFGGSLAHDKSYDIETYVCDNNQPSMGATRYSVAPGTMYYMDINPYNHHMAFGGKAEDAYPYCFKVDGVVVAYIDGTGFHNV